MAGEEVLVYARGELSVEEIRAQIAEFWHIIDNSGSSDLDADLSAAGLDRGMLAGVSRQDGIAVEAGNSGVDPITAVVLVTLAPSANVIIKDLWRKIVLPRIQKRWGDDAIGEEKRSKD